MIVSNSTPLINFAAIDRLDILQALFTTVTIPSAVAYELFERGRHYSTTSKIESAPFIVRQEIQNVMLRDALTVELDVGEAEAITLALEQKADLLLLDEMCNGHKLLTWVCHSERSEESHPLVLRKLLVNQVEWDSSPMAQNDTFWTECVSHA